MPMLKVRTVVPTMVTVEAGIGHRQGAMRKVADSQLIAECKV